MRHEKRVADRQKVRQLWSMLRRGDLEGELEGGECEVTNFPSFNGLRFYRRGAGRNGKLVMFRGRRRAIYWTLGNVLDPT